MKKVFLFLLLAGFFAACADLTENPVAGPEFSEDADFVLTQEEAEADLLSILNDEGLQGPVTRSSGTRRIAERYTLGSPVETRSEGETEPYIHIFNFENEEGFAIMSGDERVPSLLALSFGGSFIPGDTIDNPGLAIFLEGLGPYFATQIAPIPPGGPGGFDDGELIYTFTGTMYGPWQNTYIKPSVTGYCRVHWHQGSFYNKYCPLIDGEAPLVGCLPIAVGQLMSMYKHPADHGEHSFDWEDISRSSATPGGRDLISRLLEQLGLPQNLNVDYGLEESSAYMSSVERTLNNFGYTCNPFVQSYNADAVIQELRAGYPCLISGASKEILSTILGVVVGRKYDEGHAWLVHGAMTRERTATAYVNDIPVSNWSEKEDYLLCNMGWGSEGDGYYLAGVFNTNRGPVFPNPPLTRSYVEGYYRYEVKMITRIRKK